MKQLGLGIAWRAPLALAIDRFPDLGFVEVMAEDLDPRGTLPPAIESLRAKRIPIIPHGVALSLGSADPPHRKRLSDLARLAERLDAPLISEHLAFVRGGGIEVGYLLPLPRTRECLEIVVGNVRMARESLPVPLAIENIATLVAWPHAEMDEATFLAELLDRADVGLLLDVENVHANARNHGGDPAEFLDRLPLERLAYVHVGGGVDRAGFYHDTHAHPVPDPVLALLEELAARVDIPGVLLERDDDFPSTMELYGEMAAIARSCARGVARRQPATCKLR